MKYIIEIEVEVDSSKIPFENAKQKEDFEKECITEVLIGAYDSVIDQIMRNNLKKAEHIGRIIL